ncbi:gliding motility-associated ABC transporter ATP-binding subunit GldA [Sphingobacteriales bacterium UPWRP_1]|nr:gliding motility-associated ABC transporter ATP-binding subunit GldA [Sphingobacteriales bacterium TSM_CSM]PSJ76145.1 gliding motility-associated ABC transporter ATP-binding subunit GldA [Sphingobacteriales bacterium UPWRP_1]
MSVQVSGLSKIYGAQKAVNNISFEAREGEILGFLGPNGAGKTTTMKILTCFIPPSKGTATVCGFDVQQAPMEVRRAIGYLPEHNPLYADMYVRESLEFIARLHQLGKNTRNRIDEMIQLTGLEREQKKHIGQLSKGYRQRVGLAQAMIHNPRVLILDEPTSGLDPNQLAEIRNVIKTLGKEKTVILSTHIMQEVQALCNRVVILDRGQIVANDLTENLQHRSQAKTTVVAEFTPNPQLADLQLLPHVGRVEAWGNKWRLYPDSEYDLRPEIFRFAVQNNLTLLTLLQEESSLEDVFRQLTAGSHEQPQPVA